MKKENKNKNMAIFIFPLYFCSLFRLKISMMHFLETDTATLRSEIPQFAFMICFTYIFIVYTCNYN